MPLQAAEAVFTENINKKAQGSIHYTAVLHHTTHACT